MWQTELRFETSIFQQERYEPSQLVLYPKYCTKMPWTVGHFIYSAQCICYLKRSAGKKGNTIHTHREHFE